MSTTRLQYLESNKLTPGKAVTITNRDGHAGVMSVVFEDGNQCSMGFPAARKIQVELAG